MKAMLGPRHATTGACDTFDGSLIAYCGEGEVDMEEGERVRERRGGDGR